MVSTTKKRVEHESAFRLGSYQSKRAKVSRETYVLNSGNEDEREERKLTLPLPLLPTKKMKRLARISLLLFMALKALASAAAAAE